jgi:hypothetical protein
MLTFLLAALLAPEFTVLWSDTDPHLKRNPSHPDYVTAPRIALRWNDKTSPFAAGHSVAATASQPEFDFAVEKRGTEITFTLTPKRDAYFSVAYTGAPATPLADTIPVPQECAARKFNFVLCEADLKLPRVHVATKSGHNIALVADPRECRFRLPTLADSRFGLMLHLEHGKLKPVLFAPLLGGAESKMKAGQPYRFTFRCVERNGDWKETYRYIARDIHGFRDQRDNSGPGPLTDTLHRTMAFLSGPHSMWDPQQKYYDYFTDKTGVFKPFSPLYGLSAAIVTDDEDFFRQRARPAVEFALSRRNKQARSGGSSRFRCGWVASARLVERASRPFL